MVEGEHERVTVLQIAVLGINSHWWFLWLTYQFYLHVTDGSEDLCPHLTDDNLPHLIDHCMIIMIVSSFKYYTSSHLRLTTGGEFTMTVL